MGHGEHVHIHYNNQAKQESDEDMQGKIQFIDLVKFNPMHFHLNFFDTQSWLIVLGGAPTLATGLFGAAFSYNYFASQSRPFQPYVHFYRGFGRLLLGFTLGVAFGYSRFGDRQRLHNAWVSERLMRRYPESMNLHEHHLWRCKGVQAPHEFYRWV